MLEAATNELLTNTDSGTPMGELFRRFWLPVALSSELPRDATAPVAVKLLGEELVAFRDAAGRVGLLDGRCAHRGAALSLGRSEGCGLRCAYHGWQYDVAGRLIQPEDAPALAWQPLLRSYPCREAGDLVWAYLGPPERLPPFPEFEWTRLPPSYRYVGKFRVECNYLQSMEGDYDPTHFAFLHANLDELRGTVDARPVGPINLNNGIAGRWVLDERTWGRLEDSESGVLCTATEELPDGRFFAGVGALWMMPIFCTGAVGGTKLHSGNFRVPIDHRSLMFYRLRWSYEPLDAAAVAGYSQGGDFYPALLPGSFRPVDNKANDYNIDRQAQRQRSFSGIHSFPIQDIAVTENQWGPLADRRREHLTSADRQLTFIRGRLVRAARAMARGDEPPEPWNPEAYRYHYESAVGDSAEQAVALAKARARASRIPEAEAVATAFRTG